MKKLTEKLNKFIPAHDKLKHSFLGDTAYAVLLLLSLIFHVLTSLYIPIFVISLSVIMATILWEYFQKKNGGINSKKEIFLDLFWGNIKHLVITFCWIFLN